MISDKDYDTLRKSAKHTVNTISKWYKRLGWKFIDPGMTPEGCLVSILKIVDNDVDSPLKPKRIWAPQKKVI